jgi:hypothetical protein
MLLGMWKIGLQDIQYLLGLTSQDNVFILTATAGAWLSFKIKNKGMEYLWFADRSHCQQ